MKNRFWVYAIIGALLLVVASPVGFAQGEGTRLVDIDYFENDIKSVFNDLAYHADVTILVDDQVHGIISLSLKNVELERAISIICLKGDYGYRKIEENLYVVGLLDPRNPTFRKHAFTESVKLNYAQAEDIVGLLRHHSDYLEARDNIIVVRGWPNQIEAIVEEIKALDKPIPQVVGQVIIAEVTSEAKKELGVGKLGESLGATVNLSEGQVSLSIADSLKIASILKVLQAEGKAYLRASTSVVVPEGGEATISIGKEIWQLIDRGAQNSYSIEKMLAATELNLGVKRITSNNEIWMSYDVGSGDITGGFQSDSPTVLTRRAKGTVIVENNALFTIGGLTKEVDAETRGVFPANSQSMRHDTELLIIILPHIIGTPMPEENLIDVKAEQFIDASTEKITNKNKGNKDFQRAEVFISAFNAAGLDDFAESKGHKAIGVKAMLEGQLNFSPAVGLFGGVGAVPTGNSLKLSYGGIILSTGSMFRTPELYLGIGVGRGQLTLGPDIYEFTSKFGRVGLDFQVTDKLMFGVGYNYMPAEFKIDGTEFNVGGPYMRLGFSFQ